MPDNRDFKSKKLQLVQLSKKYRRKLKITFDEKVEVEKKPKMSEEKFVKEIERAKTEKKVTRLYVDLHDHQNRIIISELESWEILISKTFEIFGNIKPFLEFLKEEHFPHFGYWTSNSEHLHLGLATA